MSYQYHFICVCITQYIIVVWKDVWIDGIKIDWTLDMIGWAFLLCPTIPNLAYVLYHVVTKKVILLLIANITLLVMR